MAHRDIPDAAVTAGARATAYLMRRLRDNMRAADYYRAAIADMLDETTGHRHGTGTVDFEAEFADRIEIKTGVNDKVPFRFGGTSQAAANETATLDPGVYTLAALAAEIQAEMRSEATASTEISVVYDSTVDSKTRGLFVFKHTGASDSPNTRVFELHFATGTGFATGVGPSIGFAKQDKKKAFGYAGDSGFVDGFLEESFTLSEGGLLEHDDFAANAFTTAKFTNNIVPTAAFDTGAVSGGGSGKIADGAVTSAKLGPAVSPAAAVIGSGSSNTFDFALSSGTGGRIPQVAISIRTVPGASVDEVYITAISFSAGQWHVTVFNASASPQDIAVAAY